MRTIKRILVFLLLCLNLHVIAQYEYPGDQSGNEPIKKKGKYASSKFFFGGNFSLWFGTTTDIELSPIVGYRLTPRLSLGLGPIYIYYKEYDYYYADYTETNIYGGRVFGQFTVFKDLNKSIKINLGDVFIYAENTFLNLQKYDILTRKYLRYDRTWIDLSVVGLGMRYPLGDKAGISIYVLWYLNKSVDYSYNNPIIRFGFDF